MTELNKIIHPTTNTHLENQPIGCGFIDFELKQETGLIALLVSTFVIIIITFIIFLRDIKDSHDLTVTGSIFSFSSFYISLS
jgi:hypothetical protein